jgi:hypothetical protein
VAQRMASPEAVPRAAGAKSPPWFGAADAAVGDAVRALTVADGASSARFYAQAITLFALAALVFYRLFPKFLMQNVDGVNLYFVVDKLLVWRSSPWETSTLTPLESMTSTLWFPLNPLFIPPFWSFAVSDNPTLRVYLLAVFAAVSIFASSLFFYRAIGFRRPFALAAAWIAAVLVMLQDTNLFQGINNVQVMAWAYVCLGLLVYVGRDRSRRGLVPLVLFQAAFLAYVFGDPVWHLTTLPVFGLVALALVIGAATTRERLLKVGCVALAFVVQAGLRTYESLFFILADTTRAVLPREYGSVTRSASSAGHVFRGDTVELALGLLLIIGLAVGHVHHLSERPRLARVVMAAALAFYVLVAAAGLAYIYYPRSPAFRVGYIMEMAYPLAALFVAGAVRRLYLTVRWAGGTRAVLSGLGGWGPPAAGLVCLAAYAAWHLRQSPATGGRFVQILLTAVGVFLLARLGWVRTATAVAAALMVVVLQQHVDGSYGTRGGDPQFDGAKRMGLTGGPVVQRMMAETGIQPGAPFRGYVEDLYQRYSDFPQLGDEFTQHWLVNWNRYGSGQTLFSWSLFGIPTISEYDPFIRPLYYALFSRLLNSQIDRQLDNYLGATQANEKILSLMGVRFIVTDRQDLEGIHQIMDEGKVRVLETAHPNLASYSPTRTLRATTVVETLRLLQSDAFDPEQQVVLNDATSVPPLVAAAPAELRFERGGYRVTASSRGWSLIVLPIQYSHCFVVARPGDQQVRLLRVNLAQTGLLFHGEVAAEVQFRRWPLASPDCQRQDYADGRALRVTEIQR